MASLTTTYARKFFERPTLDVARDLVGARLCRRLAGGTLLSGAIVEVEAYTQDDPACHASKGRTPRCEVMFGPAGHAYVYFIYGMYFCLNVVTEPRDTAGAVLIRAVDSAGTNGPGKLCREWEINKTHNGTPLTDPAGQLWIAKSPRLDDSQVCITPRVGISSAQELPWRFFVKDSPSVSRGKPGPTSKQKLLRTKGK